MEPNQTNVTSSSKPKKWLIIVVGIVLIAVGLTYWYIHKKENTPPKDPRLEALEILEATSSPVTATIEERTATLDNLEKSSKPSSSSVDDRVNNLQNL